MQYNLATTKGCKSDRGHGGKYWRPVRHVNGFGHCGLARGPGLSTEPFNARNTVSRRLALEQPLHYFIPRESLTTLSQNEDFPGWDMYYGWIVAKMLCKR